MPLTHIPATTGQNKRVIARHPHAAFACNFIAGLAIQGSINLKKMPDPNFLNQAINAGICFAGRYAEQKAATSAAKKAKLLQKAAFMVKKHIPARADITDAAKFCGLKPLAWEIPYSKSPLIINPLAASGPESARDRSLFLQLLVSKIGISLPPKEVFKTEVALTDGDFDDLSTEGASFAGQSSIYEGDIVQYAHSFGITLSFGASLEEGHTCSLFQADGGWCFFNPKAIDRSSNGYAWYGNTDQDYVEIFSRINEVAIAYKTPTFLVMLWQPVADESLSMFTAVGASDDVDDWQSVGQITS